MLFYCFECDLEIDTDEPITQCSKCQSETYEWPGEKKVTYKVPPKVESSHITFEKDTRCECKSCPCMCACSCRKCPCCNGTEQ